MQVMSCCPPVLHAPLAKRDADDLATLFRALADPARLRLLSFINAQPDGAACVCNLTSPVGLSQPTVSHHLKVLSDAGLLSREKRGTWVFYRVVRARVAAIARALAVPRATSRDASRRRTRLATTGVVTRRA